MALTNLDRFNVAKEDITKYLFPSDSHVFKRLDLEHVLVDNRENWRLTNSLSTDKFINILVENTSLSEIIFEFPDRNIYRYIYGKPSIYSIVSSLRLRAYYSHFSALFLNGLTDQVPKSIYLNKEQTPKPKNKSSLEQASIDRAFKSSQRITNNFAFYQNTKIYVLSGMHTGEAGVTELTNSDGVNIRLTNMERTLIDSVVRPFYSGGVSMVLDSFRNAKDRISVNKLSAMLKKLDYVYPYHQAIGFYLEKSDVYPKSLIDIFESNEKNYDFYLTHKMEETEYSKKWKLFYPKGF